MTKTTNYQLNQWDPEDRVIRTDFNEDNAKIDAALHTLKQGKADAAAVTSLQTSVSQLQTTTNQAYSPSNKGFVTGVYTGNGTATRFISLGFTPSVVLVYTQTGTINNDIYAYGGLALLDNPSGCGAEIGTNGFQVKETDVGMRAHTNKAGYVYYYLAFR